MPRIFGTDGVRDVAGKGHLAPDRVRLLGRAAGTLLRRDPALFRSSLPRAFRHLAAGGPARGEGSGRVLVGRDTRVSGPDLERWLAEGFRSAGVGVVRAGILTTPGVSRLVRAWGCALGAVISASHNPARDNGIKFVSPQGFKIPDAAEAAIEELMESGAVRARRGPPPRDFSRRTGDYLDALAALGPPLGGLRIAVDCAHGAASAYAGPLLERLGARPVVTGASPDGRNINAGCGALHPERLARGVVREKARLGVAFDGDADRAIFVDETGEVRDGDHVLALCGIHLKEKRKLPGNLVVSTVMANFGLERALRERGIALARTKVGDRFVAEEMLRSGAVLGGEQSGHVLFFDAAPAGDGLLTLLRVLGVMVESDRPLSELAGVLSKLPQVLLNVAVGRKPPLEEVPEVRRAARAAERSLRGDGRVLVRYSGTEPLCRVMVEGADARRVDRAARDVADVVKKVLA